MLEIFHGRGSDALHHSFTSSYLLLVSLSSCCCDYVSSVTCFFLTSPATIRNSALAPKTILKASMCTTERSCRTCRWQCLSQGIKMCSRAHARPSTLVSHRSLFISVQFESFLIRNLYKSTFTLSLELPSQQEIVSKANLELFRLELEMSSPIDAFPTTRAGCEFDEQQQPHLNPLYETRPNIGSFQVPVRSHVSLRVQDSSKVLTSLQVSGVQCRTCAASGYEVWVVPGNVCQVCGTQL